MRTFFSSFRNAFISILCAIVVLVVVGVGIAYAVEAQGKNVLDRNTALEYALADAKVSASDITITKQKLEQENGKNCYEIEFFTDTYEYKYEIDAATGKVVGVSIEALFDRPAALADNAGGNPDENAVPEGGMPEQPVFPDGSGTSDDQQDGSGSGARQPDSQPSGSGQTSQPSGSGQSGQPGSQTGQGSSQGNQIGLDAAKEKALSDAGLSLSDVTFTKGELDLDDGVYVYDIEFHAAGMEYEYEINAATGAIVDKSTETIQDHRSSGTSGTTGTSGGSGTSGASGASGSAYIGEERAKEIAVGDAGVKLSDAAFTKSKLDLDDGIYVYDIEFYTTSAEYEYEINAATGAIVDKSMETIQGRRSSDTSGTTGTSGGSGTLGASGASGSGSAYIGEDRAKEIAVGDAGVKLSDATFTKSKLDLDDGIYVYDIEFYTTSAEYEYEINAATGAVLDKDVEMFQTVGSSGTSGNTGSYIGVDRAKEIAVGHAGFGISDVVFTKAKVEREDGCTQYEIEFCKGTSEYEYCIDAFSGSILEYDCEYDEDDHHGNHHGH